MRDGADQLGPIRQYSPVVFFNHAAGRRRAQSHLSRIRKLFQSLEQPAQFVLTTSIAELESAAKTAIAKDHGLLIAMGGDGTFQALANASFGEKALLGVIPTGGGNDFAAALGLPRDPVEAAEALLRGVEKLVDLVRVHTADGRTRLYLGGGGVGLDSEAARLASGQYRSLPGRLRYVASALHALAKHKLIQVRIDFPESDLPSIEAQALLVAVLNAPTYGAGVRLAPTATIDDGSLDIVMIESLRASEVLRLLPNLLANGELQTSRVKRWRAKRVRITTCPSSIFHGDGEILGMAPVDIEVLPQALRVLAPKPNPGS